MLGPVTRVAAAAAVAVLVVAVGASSADTFTVRLVSQTTSTVTLGWDPQPGYGYLFSTDGVLVSRTNDPARSSVKFAKASSYEVAVIVKGATGTYPPPAPPPPPAGDTQAPSAPANLRTTSVSQTSAAIAWDAATDNVAVTNYRIFRGGALLGQGPGSSGGFADAWNDSGLACGTSYVYGVDAQDAAGNTSTRTTLSVTTLACDPSTPPASGNVVEFTGTVTAAAFLQGINAAPAGAVTVRPAAGQSSFTVSGDFQLNRQNVTIQKAVVRDVTVTESGSGFVLEDSKAHAFIIDGADDWIMRRDTVPFGGVTYNGYGGSVMFGARNWRILDSTFTGCYVTANLSQHTECWYIGAGNDGGLIQGNTFDDNGSTGHLFFTWYGMNQTGSGPYDPVNICVTGNTFTRSHNAYWHIDMRSELKWATNNIDIDPNTNTWDKPYSYTILAPYGVRPC